MVVTVQKQDEDDDNITLLFAVSDTGIGIPAHKQAQIFDSFSQAASSITRQFGGTGLGLTISHQLVQLMGGNMWVESQEGQGSTFFFILPFVKSLEPASEFIILPDTTVLNGVRVMIIDDNATNRHILQKTLQAFGCITFEAADGSQGLTQLMKAAADERPFDLVLLDVMMEPLTGLEVLQIIQRRPELANLAVIMLTSLDSVKRLNPDTQEGWVEYLTKPVKQTDLIAAISTVLNKNLSQTQLVATAADKAALHSTNASINILLVEDNEINRQVAIGILRRLGHQVATAEDGRQALEWLEKNSAFDLILMDVQMPIMDGLQTTKLIRQELRWQHIPIIALTAHAMQGDRERFMEVGMNDYLSKPIRSKDVTDIIERHRVRSSSTNHSLQIRTLSSATTHFEKSLTRCAAPISTVRGNRFKE
ncbi:MAG: response regulator [Anaerolineae bacterium]|nr:response regulator [Anaerolineae bacterium]